MEDETCEELVTIATYSRPEWAQIALGLLESEGIECYLADENAAVLVPFLGPGLCPVKLQVRESDAEEATEILEQSNALAEEDAE